MQSTTEFLSSISPQAEGERTVASLLAKKPSVMPFFGMPFPMIDALHSCKGAGLLHKGEALYQVVILHLSEVKRYHSSFGYRRPRETLLRGEDTNGNLRFLVALMLRIW